MTIKRLIMTLVMVAAVALMVTQVSAQEKTMTPDTAHVKAMVQKKDHMEQHLAMLKDKLNLSDSQMTQVKAIYEESEKQEMTEKGEVSAKSEQTMKAHMEARKATDDKIMQVLNDDQKKEYTKMMEEQQKNMKEHHRKTDQNKQEAKPGQGNKTLAPGK